MLKKEFNIENKYEIGVDECARGPMFGRLYTAAVILPKENFRHEDMKDSKKIKSKIKMRELSDYIKQNAHAWYIDYIEADEIDKINIRQAVLKSMRRSIQEVILKGIHSNDYLNTFLVIDGNDFSEFKELSTSQTIPHTCVEKGDNTYSFIAAASILAKCAHDEYIENLCIEYPELQTKYKLADNVGYGTKYHLEGIKEYGITQWHRKTYGCCKNAKYTPITTKNDI